MSDVDIIINVATQGAKSITDLSASLRSLNKDLVNLNIPLKKLDAHTMAVNKALGLGASGANDHAKSIRGLVTNQKALGSETRRIKTEINAFRAAIGFAGSNNTKFAKEANATIASLKGMGNAMRGLRIRAFGSDLRSSSLHLQKIGKDAQFVGRSLMINLTAPLTLFARSGFQQLLSVDKELVRLTKVLDNVAMSAEQAQRKLGDGASPDQVRGLVSAYDQLNNSLTKISSNYGVSKQLIVGLASDFAELGINGHASIIALTELTAKIEKLGAMDISGAQDLTQALYFQSVRAYQNTGAFDGVTKAVDREAMAVKAATTQMYLFNAIENVTALTLKDLGQAFPEIASMAVSFGLSMTEAAAMLAPMKAAGLDVGASANSIKVSLQRMLSPTTKNQKTLKALAETFGEAGDSTSAFATASKTGLTGLQSITEIFDKVMASKGGMEGAMKLMSNLFEKRQGPRMFLAIEQLSMFNKELNSVSRSSTSTEGMLAGVAENALVQFNKLNGTALPATINNFKDIGIIARIATAHVGQEVEGFVDSQGKLIEVSAKQIKTAKEARKAVADRILMEKQTKGRDVVSEVKTETGRAMIVELAGASNAAAVANAELRESLLSLSVITERLKNNFKLFAADLMKAVVPVLKNLSEKVQELMDRWNNASEEFRARVSKIVGAMIGFLAILGPVVLAIGTMQAVTGVLGRALSTFIPRLRNTEGGFMGVGKAAEMATARVKLFQRAQDETYKQAILRGVKGMPNAQVSGLSKPDDAISEVTKKAQQVFGKNYKPPLKKQTYIKTVKDLSPQNEAQILSDSIKKNYMATGAGKGMNAKQLNADIQKATNIATQFRSGTSIADMSTADFDYFMKNQSSVTGASQGLRLGDAEINKQKASILKQQTAAQQMRAQAKRPNLIASRNPLYEKAGVLTDEAGSKFFKSGREITEKRAGQLATGKMAGRIGDAKDSALSKISGVATKGKNLGKGALDAVNPVKQYQSAMAGARGAVKALAAENKRFELEAPGIFAKARVAIMGFTKGIKLADIGMKILRMTMIASGIGAILLVIGVAVYAVVKNFDKFKTGAKPAIDALKKAFDQIKQAIVDVLRPIFDLFAAFGKGSDTGSAAANGIGAAFGKLAGVIGFVSRLVQRLLYNIFVPIMQAIANAVLAVVSIFKGNWSNAFNYLIAALGYTGKLFINIWKMLGDVVISIIAGIVKGGIKLFFILVNGFAQMIIGQLKMIVGAADKVLGFFGKGHLLDGAMEGLDKVGSAVSNTVGKVSDSVTGLVDAGADGAKRLTGKVASTITNQLTKATDKGMKNSTGAILKNKKPITDAGKEVGEAGGEAIANAMGDASAAAGEKAGKAIKDGMMDAAQKLQDYVRDAFKSALDKMISATVDAMKKQKDAGLKVFDIQLKTLDKLEKAEESLTKTKEYQQNLRKILDDRDLNRANYIRNRALAIYEGRVDDARMLDLQSQVDKASSVADETNLNDSRRKDLAAENLTALREAIAEAKDKAGELFDLQIEAFQKASADIIKIGPVTIEQYTVMQKELEALANTSSTKMNEDFGNMFETFATTIADKMPNKVVGAFSTNLDLLVEEARNKYGLGSDASEKTIIGVTIGMLTSIGDKMGEGAPAVIEAFGAITTDLHSNFTEAKDAILIDVQEAFLVPFKKAFDEADPTAVFNQAIADGNLQMLRDFENTLALNKALMDKMIALLDPAISKWLELKAAIDGANNAASGGGAGDLPPPTTPLGSGAGGRADAFEANNAIRNKRGLSSITYQEFINGSGSATTKLMALQSAKVKELKAQTGYKAGGYIPAPITQGVPALLHGGEYVLNASAVSRIGVDVLEKMNTNNIPKFKNGGRVPGASMSGILPKIINSNQYSINSDAIKDMGMATMSNINNARFKTPSGAPSYNSGSQTTTVSTVNINVDTFIGEEDWFKGMMKNYNINILPRVQKNAGNETRSFTTYNGLNQGS